MKGYLRWSLTQLYLIVFRPTRFAQEVEGRARAGRVRLPYRERLRYLLKMSPWIIAPAAAANLAAGSLGEYFGVTYMWPASWYGTALGIIAGGAVGIVGGVAAGWAAGVGAGPILAVPAGVAVGVTPQIWVSYTLGVASALAALISIGVAIRRRDFVTDRSSVWPVLTLAGALAVAAGLGLSIAIFTPIFASTVPVTVANGVMMSLVAAICYGVMMGLAGGAVFGVARGVSFALIFGLLMGAAGGLAFGLLGAAFFGGQLGLAVGLAFLSAYPVAMWLSYFRLPLYPLHVLITAGIYARAARQPESAHRLWRRCPVVWDELIWLPLPFVSRLLALLAEWRRDEGFRHITFVAAERPHQRRGAVAALAGVVSNDLSAESLAELPAAAERVAWTTDVGDQNLPRGLAAALPRFERAAQHIGQYLTLDNAYRKAEVLRKAAAEIETLRRSLVAARGSYAPPLLKIADQWQALLDPEKRKAEALAEGAREIPNPFMFGNPVMETAHNVFAGRLDIVRQIEASVLGVSQVPTLLLHGPRRVGKTSILNQLPRLLGPDFAPAVLNCQNPAVTASEATLLRYLSRELSAGLRRRRVAFEPLTAASLEREPFVTFDEWLDGLESALPEGMRVLLCLDEYERLQATLDAGWGGKFLDALRHTLQYRPRVLLLFTGARTFQELGSAWTDRFISARRVRVSFLSRADVELLLTKPIPEFNMTYAPGSLDAVIAATNCQPFLTQAVAFELVQFLNERQRREATPEDVEAAVARALSSGSEYLANVWSDAGPDGRALLRAIARGETPPDAPAARAWLREHDVLDAGGDFAVEMVRRWVRAQP